MATEAIEGKTPVNNQAKVTHINPITDAKDMFTDLGTEIKEETEVMKSGEQPVKQKSDFLVRKHLIGIIILLFGVVALILLVAMGGIGMFGHLSH